MLNPFPNSSEVLELFLDQISEGFALTDANHKVLFFNKPFYDFLIGTVKKDLKKQSDIREFLSPPIKEIYLNHLSHSIKDKNTVIDLETSFNDKLIWYEYKFTTIHNNSNKVIANAFRIKCIDEEKRNRIKAENTLENLNAIFENATDSIILLDKNYKVLGFNNLAKQRLIENAKRELFIGEDFRDCLYPGSEKKFIEIFDKACEGSPGESEINAKSIYGVDIWFRAKMFPVYNKKGDFLGIALFTVNITERKKAEIALKESEEKFRKILESAPAPILTLDMNLKIVLSNEETERTFGYSQQELKGKEIKILIPEWDNVSKQINRAENTLAKNRTINGKRKNGKEINLEVYLNDFLEKNEKFTILIIQNITEQIKAEQKILDQYHKLQEIAKHQSHEVRRPVANILGIINIFKTIKDLSEEDKNTFFEHLYTSSTELDEIIEKIVRYASYSGDN